jgi:prepilin signal peptidase PulO-like enzyme (type II secretory pathway)
MFILYLLFAVVLGMYIGSFITATSLRIACNETLLVKRSKCDSCKGVIKPLYLTPILGYFLCRGRCVMCDKKISLEYTLWETLHTMLYLVNFIYFKNNPLALFCICGITSILMMISIIDIKTMYIYDLHIIILFIFCIVFLFLTSNLHLEISSFIMALMPWFFKAMYEYIRYKITKNSLEVIGVGDVKLLTLLFFLLDFYNIAIIIALSGFIGVIFGMTVGRKNNIHYPFAPSISISIYGLFILFL